MSITYKNLRVNPTELAKRKRIPPVRDDDNYRLVYLASIIACLNKTQSSSVFDAISSEELADMISNEAMVMYEAFEKTSTVSMGSFLTFLAEDTNLPVPTALGKLSTFRYSAFATTNDPKEFIVAYITWPVGVPQAIVIVPGENKTFIFSAEASTVIVIDSATPFRCMTSLENQGTVSKVSYYSSVMDVSSKGKEEEGIHGSKDDPMVIEDSVEDQKKGLETAVSLTEEVASSMQIEENEEVNDEKEKEPTDADQMEEDNDEEPRSLLSMLDTGSSMLDDPEQKKQATPKAPAKRKLRMRSRRSSKK